MRGSTHAAIGLVSPLWVSMHSQDLMSCAVMSLVAAGASLGPDIDTPRSTVSKALPKKVHQMAHTLSRSARLKTSTGKDNQAAAWKMKNGHDPEHRMLTHTAVSAVAVGAASWVAASVPFGTAAMCALAAYTVGRIMKKRALSMLLLGAGLAFGLLASVDPMLVGVAAALGWLSHIIADGCTKAGVPLMWPAQINGKSWWKVRFLGSHLESGSPRELVVGSGIIVLLAVPLLQQLFA